MGYVEHAGWTVTYQLPFTGPLAGGGLIVNCATFQKRLVLLRGSCPFAIVPYHHADGPFFKDGLGPTGGGVSFKPLKPSAPDLGAWQTPPSEFASTEAEAVKVETHAADSFTPAHLVIWAKLNVFNYQYVHRWEFSADGRIEARVGIGGELLGSDAPSKAFYRLRNHIHNFYFRLDFALDGASDHVVERQVHSELSDAWQPLTIEGKRSVIPAEFTRWRVRHPTKKNAGGQPVAYEIEPESVDPPDGTYSTGDLWVVEKKGFNEQMGAEIGNTDAHLAAGYGSERKLAGKGVIVWAVAREHHRVEPDGEDKLTVAYHSVGLALGPRNFLDDTPAKLYVTNPPSP